MRKSFVPHYITVAVVSVLCIALDRGTFARMSEVKQFLGRSICTPNTAKAIVWFYFAAPSALWIFP